jgi:uncharacterized membrane protein
MDASANNKKGPGAGTGGDGNYYPSLVGKTLVALAGTCTVIAVVLGVVYAVKSSPTDPYVGLEWFASSFLSAMAALVFWVVAICHAAIRYVLRKRRARRVAIG